MGECLVVVDDIEGAQRVEVVTHQAHPEGPGLGETCRAHGRELDDVHPIAELAQVRHAEGVGLAIEIQARHLDQIHAGVEFRIGLPGEDRHLMAQRHEFAGEMSQVDPLPTAMGLGSIGQQRDTHDASLSRW